MEVILDWPKACSLETNFNEKCWVTSEIKNEDGQTHHLHYTFILYTLSKVCLMTNNSTEIDPNM
jgi:hypothetical protein